MPPKSQCNQESTSPFQGTVAYCRSEWRSRDKMSYWCFPFDTRIGFELITEEFDLGTHGFVDIILVGCVMR
jgi:hypothetical protein